MIHVMELLVLGALGLVLAYPYFVYPAILHFLTWRCMATSPARDQANDWERKTISMLLAVHNEERVIAERIRNFVEQEYPEDRMELIVVSDGSTDRTEQIVNSLGNPRVRLLVQERAGKTAALNSAATIATGEIYVFSDANTMFRPDAVAKLVRHFADPEVGLAAGQALSGERTTSEGIYHRFERFLKARESRLGTIAGADGAIYALRAELWQPLDPAVTNDFYHPIHVALSGSRSVFDPHARATESPVDNVKREFPRQKRMAAQAFGILWRNLWPLARSAKFLALWVLVSHRILRWAHAPAMAASLLILVYLGWTREALWMYLLVGGYVGATVLGAVGPSNSAGRIFRLYFDFELVHLAYICGILDWLRGRTYVTWNPRGGEPDNA